MLLPQRLSFLPADVVRRYAQTDRAYQSRLRRQATERRRAERIKAAKAAFVPCPARIRIPDAGTLEVKLKMLTFEQQNKRDLTCFVAGKLRLPTGKLVAGDPLTSMETVSALGADIAPGSYPVVLTLSDAHVAFGMVRVRDQPAVRWVKGHFQGQKPDPSKGAAAYGVDAGMGGYADQSLQRQLMARDLYQRMKEAGMYRNRATVLDDFKGTEANLVAFSSGYGDGVYGNYFGYAADGALVAVVTDFHVVDD